MSVFGRRAVLTTSTAIAAAILTAGPAVAVTISDCVDNGGVVVRCSTRPVTNSDKVCPTPGRTYRIWCVGGFFGSPEPLEIFDSGGHSRYE